MSITDPPKPATPSSAAAQDSSATASHSPGPIVHGWATLGLLSRYQWFVFLVAVSAWMLDCMDQQFFTLSRTKAMTDLVAPPAENDPRIETFARTKFDTPKNPANADDRKAILAKIHAEAIDSWGFYATSAFLVGWALGGLGFGIMGDRLGRVKTLSLTILIYSIFTGLSAVSQGPVDFLLYRLLTGLGVGGVFAVVVALIAESVPDRARPYTLGLLQVLSAIGNCTAALIFMYFGHLEQQGFFSNLTIMGFGPVKAWQLMFLIGIVPGLLAVLVQLWVKEPEKWREAKASGRKVGSFRELLGHSTWRRHAVFGLLLAIAGVVGLWSIGFFSPDLQQRVMTKTFTAEAENLGLNPTEAANYIAGQKTFWAGVTLLMMNFGAAAGMFAFSWLTSFTGRKSAFAVSLLAAAGSTALVFAFMDSRNDILWMIPLMGFCQLALFGGYAIYFPELFPTRLRSTGTSFCYNFGRLLAAVAPALMVTLRTDVFGKYAEGFRWGGVTMCSVFLLGLVALPFLPETKGKPLPE
jgi:MFS family permease